MLTGSLLDMIVEWVKECVVQDEQLSEKYQVEGLAFMFYISKATSTTACME